MIVCRPKAGKPRRRTAAITLGASVLALCVVPLLALCGVRAPYRQLHKTADTLHRAQYFSYMGFHLGDIAATAVGHQPHIDAEDEALLAAYRAWQAEDTTVGAHPGALEGKNLIVIQVESLESFVLGKSIDGLEITPTLNRLMTGGYTFSNIYEQVKGGNSSDCDFLLMTGLLPIDSNYVFGTHADEPYLSLQTVLKERAGYTSYYFHGGTNSSWNYEDMLRDGIRVQHINGDYVQDEILNDYVSDESFFRQTVKMVTGSEQSAYAAMDKALTEAGKVEDSPCTTTTFQGTRQDAGLRGSIRGIGIVNFTPVHLMRSFMYGMAQELYGMYRSFLDAGGTAPEAIIGSGNGLRKNAHLCRAFEAVFACPLILSSCEEEAACGAAMYAARHENTRRF